ncbi:MAG: histidine phosphatase family protein [Rhodovibrionaceae bacterium]
MKRIYLLRHAKSSWDDPKLGDFERPLNGRGRKTAPRIGRLLAERGWLPDLALCSSAERARETWELLAAELPGAVDCKRMKGLYLAPPSQLLRQIERCPDAAQAVLLVGHNPGLETLALQLAGPGSDAKALARLRAKYPTAALAVFDLDTARWKDIAAARSELRAFIAPRSLDEES